MRLETLILTQLIQNEDYCRKALPFLELDYFHIEAEKTIYELIREHVDKYNGVPSLEILAITLQEKPYSENLFKECVKVLSDISEQESPNISEDKWLVDKTEEFCQEKAIHNAIRESIQILEGKKKDVTKGAIPELLTKALSISFDNHIGHDWIEDFNERFELYHKIEKRVPFDLEFLNTITKGGLPNKTLTCLMAGTGVGKSLFMCHMAAANLMDNKKVLYITLEMAEERIAERIDANLLDVEISKLETLTKEAYEKKVSKIRDKTQGRLIIKEYPTACAGAGHFRHLLNELRLKKNFIPDIIYIDYLNICCSMRLKYGANVNSYLYIKAIAEEIRGLAVERDVPIVTATQSNRSGSTNSDVGMDEVSDSFGLPMTLDLMLAIISSEDLAGLNQVMVKQLKNRFNDIGLHIRFVLGVDKSRMRLYDVEQSAQDDISSGENSRESDVPVMDGAVFGARFNDEASQGAGRKSAFKTLR